MEQSRKEESELEEGEISEDAEESKRGVIKKQEDSSNVETLNNIPSSVKAPNMGNEIATNTAVRTSAQNRMMYNRRGRNSFVGRVNAPGFYRKKEFTSITRSGIGLHSNLQKLRYDAKVKDGMSRRNYVPRQSVTPGGFRNVQRSVFFSNINHKEGNSGEFIDIDNDASYEELLEQYRQIKCRLHDLNEEEEEKQSDKVKIADKSSKSYNLKLGNNKENWQLKQGQTKKGKGASVNHSLERTNVYKGRHSYLPRTTPVRRRRRPYEYHKQSKKSKTSQEKHKQKPRRKEDNKNTNDDDEDLLELRKQALATLSKQSNCNKLKESCAEIKSDNNDTSAGEFTQDQKTAMFNVLGDNYEEVAMDLDSDICPDSTEEVPEKKHAVEDPELGDEIDEEELRKQLLESIAGKKRQREQVEKQEENEFSEPTVDEVLPSCPPEKNTATLDDIPKAVTCNIITTAEPLVINLAEDSSSEEESDKHQVSASVTAPVPEVLPPGLEQLIKDARMQSEKRQASIAVGGGTPAAVQKLSQAQQQEYRKLKEEIAKRESVLKVENNDTCNSSTSDIEKLDAKIMIAKSEINREQERLQNLRIQLARKKFIARNSQAKVQKLKEQLAAAERELVLDMQMIKISSAKIKEVQLSLHKKVLNFQALQKKCLQDSNRTSGIDKISNLQVNGATKQNSVTKLGVEKRNPVAVVSNTPKAKMTAAEIMSERERLQKLEKEIALQLEELRQKSRKTLSAKPANTKVALKPSPHNYKRKFASSSNALSRPNTRSVKKLKFDAQMPVHSQALLEGTLGQKNLEKLQGVSTGSTTIDDKKQLSVIHNHGALDSLKDYQGTSELLDQYSRLPLLLYTYQLCDIFWPKLEKLELDDLCEDIKSDSSSDIILNYSYTSPLLHMNSYRLHPHFAFQEQQSLASNTYSNALDAKRGLCRFDLLGTCNDDKCTWQHETHYKLSNEEIVADLLAYAPSVSGIISTDDAQQYEAKLLKASAKLLQENVNLSLEDVCKEALLKVNASLDNKAPNFIVLTKRSWRPYRKRTNNGSTEDWEISKQMKEFKFSEQPHEECDFDNLITDADKRYYTIEEKMTDRLEEVITENEKNIQLWLKLAYKRLYSSESPELCLEQSLNVLSRALESNQDNPELWKNYLNLYAQHPASKDVISVCQEALQWCPRYEIWWKYLQLAEGYKNKYEICSQFLESLMSSKMQQCYNKESLSHYILEVLLYQVQLSLQVGKYETAIMTLKERLKKKGCEVSQVSSSNNYEVHKDSVQRPVLISDIVGTDEQGNTKVNEKFSGNVTVDCISYKGEMEKIEHCSDLKLPVEFMTSSDYCFAWLCYIYVMEFKCLPLVIFQNGEDHLGHVISKNPFLIDWTQCHRLQNSKDAIKEILAQAACCCMSDRAESVEICFPLYFQIVTIELSCKNYALAVEVCEKLLHISPTNVSVWLLLARVYAYQSLEEEVFEVLMKVMVFVPYNPCIYYVASLYQFTKGNISIAKEILENFVQGFFLEPDTMPSNIFHYTELLYCKLLQHDSGRVDCLPKRNDVSISEETKVHLWLNYVLYLLCTGSSHSVILMTFEAALASFHTPEDVKIIWWQYLQFSIRYISKGNSFKDILKLLNECKITIPTNVCLPHLSGKLKYDFGFHMTVVDFFLNNIASVNDKVIAAEKFLRIFPRNTSLIERAIHYYLRCDKEDTALSLLAELPHMEAFSSYLWRLAIRLILKTGDKQEVHKFYTQAVQVLPYNQVLWLEYLIYEISESQHEHIERIKKECCRLQIDGIHS